MIFWLLVAVSAPSAFAYGAFFLRGPETLARGAVKGAFMGALALAFAPTQPFFAAALAAAAAGDALLAFEKQSWTLPLGMAAFLAMQVMYFAIFLEHGVGEVGSWRRTALAGATLAVVVGFLVWFWNDVKGRPITKWLAVFAALQVGIVIAYIVLLPGSGMVIAAPAVAVLIWLRRDLGAVRLAGMIYGGVLLLMTLTSFSLPWIAWPAMAGAMLFLISDGVLSAELFRLPPEAPARRVTAPLVWWTYAGGQALIVWGVARLAQIT